MTSWCSLQVFVAAPCPSAQFKFIKIAATGTNYWLPHAPDIEHESAAKIIAILIPQDKQGCT
jgi:hypothetical protein